MSISLSFLVPVYNVEPYLDACVQSVLTACAPGDELILVDDGSTDRSGDLCDALAARHPALVQVVHQANAGLSAARNRALRESSKDYVCFLDSDDVICAATVAAARQRLDTQQPDILTCDALLWREGQADERIAHTLPPDRLISGVDALASTCRDDFLSSCSRLYRRDFLRSLGAELFPVGQAYEDNSIVPIIVAEARRVAYLPAPLFRYRVRAGSITQSHKLPRCIDHARSLAAPLAHFQRQALSPDLQIEANLLALSHVVVAIRQAATIRHISTQDMLKVLNEGLSTLTLPSAALLDALRHAPHARKLRKHAQGMLLRPRWYATTRVLMGRWKQGRADAR
jgi:Glycosyl transferase family 2